MIQSLQTHKVPAGTKPWHSLFYAFIDALDANFNSQQNEIGIASSYITSIESASTVTGFGVPAWIPYIDGKITTYEADITAINGTLTSYDTAAGSSLTSWITSVNNKNSGYDTFIAAYNGQQAAIGTATGSDLVTWINYVNNNHLTSSQINTLVTAVDTKANNNAAAISSNTSAINALSSDTYNQSQVDSLLLPKVDTTTLTSDYYNKAYIDNLIAQYQTTTSIATDYYNKAELNAYFTSPEFMNLFYSRAYIDSTFYTGSYIDSTFATIAQFETLDINPSEIEALQTDVASHTTSINSLNSSQAVQDTTISGHTTSINSLNSSQTAQDTTISGHTTSINSLNSSQAAQDTTISGHTTAINSLNSSQADQDNTLSVHQDTLDAHTGAMNDFYSSQSSQDIQIAANTAKFNDYYLKTELANHHVLGVTTDNRLKVGEATATDAYINVKDTTAIGSNVVALASETANATGTFFIGHHTDGAPALFSSITDRPMYLLSSGGGIIVNADGSVSTLNNARTSVRINNTALSAHGVSSSWDRVSAWDELLLNDGNCFDQATGIFTVNSAGRYRITLSYSRLYSPSAGAFELTVNGAASYYICGGGSDATTSAPATTSFTVLRYFNAGDTLDVRCSHVINASSLVVLQLCIEQVS